MASSSGVACLEVFDENSQPSAEEISEYATQIGIDPDSESHLLPIAKDGLMQALPPSWRAYYDEKLKTHYYYNEENKKTQWEHPLDNVYREIVRKARDASVVDDTYVSVQELLTSEENTKQLERIETKVESDEELSTDSENNSETKELPSTNIISGPRRLAPLGRPPIAPLKPLDKKLNDLRISPLRRSLDGPSLTFKPNATRPMPDKDIAKGLDRPKLFKQHSEIIDLKMHVLNNEEDSFNLFGKGERVLKMGLPLTGKGSMFLKGKKTDLPSPDTDKSLHLDSLTKSDPPKGILREKVADTLHRKVESLSLSKPRQTANFEDDRKSVRFKLENTTVEPTMSPGSNSSSELHDGQSSIISSAPVPPRSIPSPVPFAPMPSNVVTNMPVVLSPIVRPPLPPRPANPEQSPRENSKSSSGSKESLDASPKRRLLRPPAADYINQDLFQKNFHKISDLLQDKGDNQNTDETAVKEIRPRSPMIPQMNKISINLMESIESETSIDSPDREFAVLDLNDMDDANVELEPDKNSDSKESESSSPKDDKENSEMLANSSLNEPVKKEEHSAPEIIVPKLDFLSKPPIKPQLSELGDFKPKTIGSDSKINSKADSIKIQKSVEPKIFSPTLKSSPNHSFTSDVRSPKTDSNHSPWSNFKPGLNKAIISPQLKSDSNSSLNKGSTSPRLDGVIITQGKNASNGSDNVVVMYQFEQPEENSFTKNIKSSSELARDMMERNKVDEKRRLELSLQKELEDIRVQWTVRERKMRAELQDELRENDLRFQEEKKVRLLEQQEKHLNEMKEFTKEMEQKHTSALEVFEKELQEKKRIAVEKAEEQFREDLAKLKEKYAKMLAEERRELESENERALSELRQQIQVEFHNTRTRILEENRSALEAMTEEHKLRVEEMKHDYRAEMERLRSAHSWHVSETRARLSRERAAGSRLTDDNLPDKYRCLKEKYARLKHDVKMSIERRNKRREMSMTTGSETEKSNSHKATQAMEKKEHSEPTAVMIETVADIERPRNVSYVDTNVPTYNDNETSLSDYNAQRNSDNNNVDWSRKKKPTANTESADGKGRRRPPSVIFKEAPRRKRDNNQRQRDGTTTDFQDSSEATTTADEKPRENVNGHCRRRCFTRLKSASTSRLNYSPKRGEGWSSPLESLRQQLRKLDDLEDQFPDLACQPSYSLRYPFAELGAVTAADTPELEFVRHRALIEREGMRRARAALRRRRLALRETRSLSQNAPSEEREVTELEVALHRARALLGEKEIRLQHIERALRLLADKRQAPVNVQEPTTSSASSSESGTGEAGLGVLRSLRALHADVRDIWRALDARRPVVAASPETSSCNTSAPTQTRTLSAQDPPRQSADTISERARGLRAWLQTSP